MNNKKLWLNILLVIIMILAVIEFIRTVFIYNLNYDPDKNLQNNYIEIIENHFYIEKASVKKESNFLYFNTKLILPEQNKNNYPKDTYYITERHKVNCDNYYYTRLDLNIYDKNDKLLLSPTDDITNAEYLQPENPIYDIITLMCLTKK